MTKFVLGTKLRIGDTIAVWWKPGRDTITALRLYTGAHYDLWDGKARIADFALNKTGMTIEPRSRYEVIARLGKQVQ